MHHIIHIKFCLVDKAKQCLISALHICNLLKLLLQDRLVYYCHLQVPAKINRGDVDTNCSSHHLMHTVPLIITRPILHNWYCITPNEMYSTIICFSMTHLNGRYAVVWILLNVPNWFDWSQSRPDQYQIHSGPTFLLI